MRYFIPAVFVGLLTFAWAVPSEAQKVCGNLEGTARKKCLRAEIDRGERERQNIDAKNKRLDRAKAVVCGARKVGSKVAGAAGGSVAGPGGNAAARATWTASTKVGDVAMGDGTPCK